MTPRGSSPAVTVPARAVRWFVAVLAAAAVLGPVGRVSPAGAVGDGGASSRVTRDGRIVTSILLPGRSVPPRGGTGPTTYWITLSDADLGFLLHVAAAHPELADAPLLRAVQPLLEGGTFGDVDVQVLVRNGVLTAEVRAVPTPPDPARSLARRMITVLPVLPPVVSPPPAAPVPLYEPVFVSFTPQVWATTVDRTLSASGVTARVRARPVAVRVSSGDPAGVGRVRLCAGPAVPFDPDDPASPSRQADRPGTCAFDYRTATGVNGRRDRWYGDVTVVWQAEWTTDGVTWRSLGNIPKVSLFTRRVRAVTTAVESTR